MSTEFDPQGRYDVEHADSKCGTIIKGKFEWMDGETVGYIEDDKLVSAGEVLGQLNGMTLVRNDPPGDGETRFELIEQEQEQE